MFKKYISSAVLGFFIFVISSSITFAAVFTATPSPSTTGNFTISWTGANQGMPFLSEVVNGKKVGLRGGGVDQTVQITGKPTGRYQYVLDQVTPGIGTGIAASQTLFVDVQLDITTPPPANVNVDRSLFVHDIATLDGANFSLLRVMNALAAQMSAANPADTITGTQLFARMWDAQNPTNAPNPQGIVRCTGALNGFPVECRPDPQEGKQAFDGARFIAEYRPIGLVNRFDLRNKTSLQDCGEYRMVFGRPTGGRNFIIFEAVVPNPTPGVANGCLPIQKLWQDLTNENNATTRASTLSNFFFNGIPASNVRAPIDHRNFAVNTGQIRTNQFISGSSWNLKEYKAVVENGKNTLQVATVKSNPVSSLFTDTNTDSRSVAFRSDFINNLGSLLGNPATFTLTVANNAHNNAQSHASGPTNENNFGAPANFIPGGVFSNQISSRLSQLGSTLTPIQVVNRATAMTCGGCHQPSFFGLTANNAIGNGLSWPETVGPSSPVGFVHVTETASNGIFPLSPALINVFLPARKQDMEGYLNSKGANSVAPLAAPAQSAPTNTITSKRSG